MPTYIARAPRSDLFIVVPSKHEAPLPTFTASDALSGVISTGRLAVKELRVSLSLCYRLVSPLPGFSWDKHLAHDSEYIAAWSYEVASWNDDCPRSGDFAFGPFELGKERLWLLGGGTEPGRRFCATILRPTELPPSHDVRWHHAYWQLCVDAVDHKDRRSTVVVPLLFFPCLPLATSLQEKDVTHDASVYLSSMACLGRIGKLGLTVGLPFVAKTKDDKLCILAGSSTPLTLTIDFSRIAPGALSENAVFPALISLRQQVCGSTSTMDDVVRNKKLHTQWQRLSATGSSVTWKTELLVPDSITTSFECRAFLLSVSHALTVKVSLPFSMGCSASVDVPLVVTRSSAPLDEELIRLSSGFNVVEHGSSSRSCWPGSTRSIGKAPVCISDDAALLCRDEKPITMTLNGDGFVQAAGE